MNTSGDPIARTGVAKPAIAPGKDLPAAVAPKKAQSVTIERPLSPFMFPMWYRFQITSLLSILHRFTGIALAVGSILLAWWLVAVAAGGELFAATQAFIASHVGLALLFCWSAAFFYHLCSGIRHLMWDAGRGFELKTVYRSGYTVLVATVLLTLLTWLYVFLA